MAEKLTMNITLPTQDDPLVSAIAELEAIEKTLDEAGVPVEDEERIYSLVDRVEWAVSRANVSFYMARKNDRALAHHLLEISRDRPGDSYKIKLIKILREITNCGLREAKDKVEELFYFDSNHKVEPTIKRGN